MALTRRNSHNSWISFWGAFHVGTTTPVLGVITSMQEQIEWGLRVASLVVGLLVGLLSIVSIVRKLRRS